MWHQRDEVRFLAGSSLLESLFLQLKLVLHSCLWQNTSSSIVINIIFFLAQYYLSLLIKKFSLFHSLLLKLCKHLRRLWHLSGWNTTCDLISWFYQSGIPISLLPSFWKFFGKKMTVGLYWLFSLTF